MPEENAELSSALRSLEIELPRRNELEIRTQQLKDPDLKKIIDALTNATPEVAQPWLNRGYLLNSGVLYRYSQDNDEEAAQLLVPDHERTRVLKQYHDSPTAGHYGIERTYHRIQQRYYWPAMRRYIADYLKTCHEYTRSPTTDGDHRHRPLPPASTGERWILIIEDYATRWIELFALVDATADRCAWTFVNEDLPSLYSGLSSRGKSSRTPKPGSEDPIGHSNQRQTPLRLTSTTINTGKTPAFLLFGSEIRSIDDVTNDLRGVALSENFVAEATPRLLRLHENWKDVRETHEKEQDRRKQYADSKRRPTTPFQPGDLVYADLHALSKAARGFSSKLAPRRDGPYIVLQQNGLTNYVLAARDKPAESLGTYHVSQLTRIWNLRTPRPNRFTPSRSAVDPERTRSNNLADSIRPEGKDVA
ncbi:hypothetical protein GEV33_004633 [Tenebrio molitor]|uniref:RNA-directed DNA polymerase n=1 Tax=Tenebrio molitor TaxID=7067 RepID=A0A8J6HPW6_TENMO|nr:hypothetical protein GEV33_004633 [Tenebrio molitor]